MPANDKLPAPAHRVAITAVGGPTVVIDYAGLRFLTDPTFDPPGSYEPRPGVVLTKTQGPALTPEAIFPIDVVLLSHDHHADNLDVAGRFLLSEVPRVLTTASGAQRLGPDASPIANWESIELTTPSGGLVRVTGVPAQHGPDGSERLVGEVTGFVLHASEWPSVYISGDNASLDVVHEIAAPLGRLDIAVLFTGGARLPFLGDAYLTLPSVAAPQAAQILGARTVVPVHHEGWAHFSDGPKSLRVAFAGGHLEDALVLLEPGGTADV